MRPFRRRFHLSVPLRLALFLPVTMALAAAANSAVLLGYHQPAEAAILLIPNVLLVGVALSVAARSYRSSARWVAGATDFTRRVTGGSFGRGAPRSSISELTALGAEMDTMAMALEEATDLLRREAYHDALTGLPNRAYFVQRATEAIRKGPPPDEVAVLFIDLDRFKLVNDTLGHVAGDMLLQMVSAKLQAITGEHATVARLGGDEFTVLVEGQHAQTTAVELASRTIDELSRPIEIEQREVFATASIGIAVNGHGSHGVTDLMRKADLAVYRAKAEGKARYALFDPRLDRASVDDLDLDTDLRSALGRGQISVRYQPIVELESERTVGLEALIRWNHPRRGVLPPSIFIDLAAETGEIRRLGRWVLDRSCRDLARLSASAMSAGLFVTVNLSASEFKEPALVDNVAQTLKRSGIAPRQLRIELTEGALLDDINRTVRTLEQLQELGVAVAIDDFGTGYSSLSYLQTLPIDTLKIDQSFVHAVGHSPKGNAILTAMIELGNALDLDVVAEGIETGEQAEFVRAAGCWAAQGYWYSAPLTVAELRRLLHGGPRGRVA